MNKLKQLAIKAKTNHGYSLSQEMLMEIENMEEQAKYDHEKPMYNLLPANAIDSMAKVMTFGAMKYQPNSWRLIDEPLERYRAALLRHAFAMQRGEVIDPESGLPHSAHVMVNAAFINELEDKFIGSK